MDELITKALEIKKDEDSELLKLLEESGFVLAVMLVSLINKTQDEIDDLLQNDLEELLDIVEKIYDQFEKLPKKRKLDKLLSDRSFLDGFADEVAPGMLQAFIELADGTSKEYGSTFSYKKMSRKARKELDKWLKELPEIMKLSTDKAVEKLLREAIEEGKGIGWVKARLSELPEFGYKRSRTTAITEILTMQSSGAYQSGLQLETVTGFKWHHTGGQKNPRESHQYLDGVVIPKGEVFQVGDETAEFPRAPSLSPKERVHCHCWLEFVLDEKYKKEE